MNDWWKSLIDEYVSPCSICRFGDDKYVMWEHGVGGWVFNGSTLEDHIIASDKNKLFRWVEDQIINYS